MRKNILVTGANGQLGSEIRLLAQAHASEYNFVFHDIDTFDITNDVQVKEMFSFLSPVAVVNCAAYTAVDKAESDVDKAYLINSNAVGLLSEYAQDNDAWLIHISTDYVFDGMQNVPYKENDYPNPLSIYGKSKLSGEKLLYDNEKYIIIRTSWLYSSFGNNIVKTILRLSSSHDSISFVTDQIGSPTYAADLADAIIKILVSLGSDWDNTEFSGIYHFADEGVCSWYDFACNIVTINRIPCKVNPIETSQYPTPAKRPAYSVLNKSKIKSTFGLEIPWWRNSLEKLLSLIK
jgi:dTDP-4-dehydrorhamnose reductase